MRSISLAVRLAIWSPTRESWSMRSISLSINRMSFSARIKVLLHARVPSTAPAKRAARTRATEVHTTHWVKGSSAGRYSSLSSLCPMVSRGVGVILMTV